MISRIRGGLRRESSITRVMFLTGGALWVSFWRAVGPVGIKHDVVVLECCLIMSGRVCVDV